MSQEIELKFQLDDTVISSLCCFLQTQKSIEQHALHLTNRYYDSNDHILRNKRSSLRVRGISELGRATEYELTVKSSGKALAGLHARQEFNVRLLDDQQLDLTALPQAIFENIGIDRDSLKNALIVQFSTDFDRRSWLINYQQSQIEIALDQGRITTAKAELDICEVELELKHGTPQDLLLFALELTQFELHLYSQSKAARGYRLLQNNELEKHSFNQAEMNLPTILQYWQSNEEYALIHDDLLFYKHTLHNVAQCITKFCHTEHTLQARQFKSIYDGWLAELDKIINVHNFAFSKINNQLKINLLLMLQ